MKEKEIIIAQLRAEYIVLECKKKALEDVDWNGSGKETRIIEVQQGKLLKAIQCVDDLISQTA